MLKQLQYFGRTESGVFAQALFGSNGCFEKTSGAPPFANQDTGESLRGELGKVTKKDREQFCYVLVNALGGGEFFGSNINADFFPWNALAHEGADYGYKTFLSAHAFSHHKNKDPARAFGAPVLSVLNPRMRRVELVVKLDRQKAKAEGADGVINRIDAGEFPDVSMGCLPKYAKVLRKDGRIVEIQDIKQGDEVITHKGRARRVESTFVRPHKGTIYHVKAYGHRDPLVLTEEHPLWVVRFEEMECQPDFPVSKVGRPRVKNWKRQHVCIPGSQVEKAGCFGCPVVQAPKFEWVRTDDIREGDYLALPLPSFEVTRKFSADEARLLGYYLSEGNLQYSSAGEPRAVMFSTGLHETETHAEIRSIVSRLGWSESLSEFSAEDRNGLYITINNRDFATLCKEHCGTGARTKRLSPSLMGADEETLQLFVGAYANGDGGCYKGSIYFSTASEQLSDQLRIVLARLHCIASVNEIAHKPSELVQKETVEFQVWVGTDSAWRLTATRHHPLKSQKLSSKRFFYNYEGTTYLMTPVESIDEVEYDDNVYNFGVEGDGSYLVEGLAVHNCKVPFDICSICGNQSKTRDDYCVCMRPPPELKDSLGPNKILPDGRKVCVVNTLPKFFDISFVFIGADKTAKVMAKLAMRNGVWVPQAYVLELSADAGARFYEDLEMKKAASVEKCPDRSCEDCENNCGGMAKLAGAFGKPKMAAKSKMSEIIKNIPSNVFSMKKLPSLEKGEKKLPKKALEKLSEYPLQEALGAATALGIILHPDEFQHLVLTKMGEDELMSELDKRHKVFREVPKTSPTPVEVSKKITDVLDEVLPALKEVVKERTAFGEPFVLRVTIGYSGNKNSLPTPEPVKHSLLDKISAAYNGYRRNVLLKLSQATEMVGSDPRLREMLLGDELANMFSKSASSIPVVTLDALAYFMGAHFSDRGLLSTPDVVDTMSERNQGLLVERLA